MKRFLFTTTIAMVMSFALVFNASAHDRDDWRGHEEWEHHHNHHGFYQAYYAPAPVYYAPPLVSLNIGR